MREATFRTYEEAYETPSIGENKCEGAVIDEIMEILYPVLSLYIVMVNKQLNITLHCITRKTGVGWQRGVIYKHLFTGYK